MRIRDWSSDVCSSDRMQGRRIAEHLMGVQSAGARELDYDKAASAIFTVPEIADVGLAEADDFAVGRKVRVTKVPFSASPNALSESPSRGLVKNVSDPDHGVDRKSFVWGEGE